jgi:DUF2075 family protein
MARRVFERRRLGCGGPRLIIYQSTKRQFLDDAFKRDIQEVVLESYRRRTGETVNESQIRAWTSSLIYMAKVLNDESVPEDCGVAVEYTIPQTRKRIDFLLTGRTAANGAAVVIVELKQWDYARSTMKDAVVITRLSGRLAETSHPCYQAWTYAALLHGFNEAVYQGGMQLRPCAYLHNYPETGEFLTDIFYSSHLQRAPLFLRGEAERTRLRKFILTHISSGDKGAALYTIEAGRIRPSKSLADSLVGMLRGNEEFALVDEQKLVFESALAHARAVRQEGKRVMIVEGGPGTGKSVVAVNLLVSLIAEGLTTVYVTKNAAPRAVYEARLTKSQKRSEYSYLFTGSGSFTTSGKDAFDALVVDEAHRLNEKSGLYGNMGDNQVKEIIQAARFSVFFVDESQKVTVRDIGDRDVIRRWALELGATVDEMRLESQFRCNGSGAYLAWLDHVLGIRKTANETFDTTEFDFRVVDSPTELMHLVKLRNEERNRARMVAGYCWNWKSKRNPTAMDIVLPGFQAQWNLTKDGSLWIEAPQSVREVGCIHTCQGLEVDYIGVIIGEDLVVRGDEVSVQLEKRATSDQSIRGWRKLLQDLGPDARATVEATVRNTYRTLMTRGMKGCYVYCVDLALAEHLRARLVSTPRDS